MSLLGYHVPLLRSIADDLKCAPITAVAQHPGVMEVYRITVHYYDRRACDSLATLTRTITGGVVLDMLYRRALDHKPLTYKVDEARYHKFIMALKTAGFDRLADQTGLPAYDSMDVWMIERAAGAFTRSVIVAPETVTSEAHRAIIDAVRLYLPETLRQVI